MIVKEDGCFKELYWFDFGVHDKSDSDTWKAFVEKSSREYLDSFRKIRQNIAGDGKRQ